ncbi:hypothetical protein [Calycomorphotria hydatis]|uniref:RNA polymerase sigma factor n=1 Tax=Calycomorphotria hydatis TaxID=2528027 RepID=A0A517T5E5_9PLAN|nr:hypothetical protein [Calycomorphotria hydatis]QDT63605.1 hypothetical protein V22_08290 [Calycomorphotria hydatis]
MKTEVKKYTSESGKQPLTLRDNAIEQIFGLFIDAEFNIDAKLNALNECMEKLPSQKKELVKTCYSSHSNIQHVARSLSLSADSVYQKLKRIRKTLYECITRRVSGHHGSLA